MDFLQSHLLTLVIFAPILGAVIIAFLPRDEGGQHKGVALLASLLTFALSVLLAAGFRPGARGFSFEQRSDWAPNLGFSYHVGLDGVALLLVLLTTFLGPIVVLSSWKYIQDRVKLYCIALQAQMPSLAAGTQKWLFLAFALAFAIKVPVWPLHTWLPDAHTEAPAAGSIVLAGVMLKMGTFGFVRYAMPLFPAAALQYAPAIAALGVVGIVYGSLMCMAQQDLKRLIAYSSVAHLGFVMLGLSALTPGAVNGAVLQMVNHGVSTGALFLIVGYFYERTHTRDLSQYGGVARVAPALSAVFLVVVLSSIGLPGTNGFVGEFLILIGTFTSTTPLGNWGSLPRGQVLSVLAATGVILGAVYMLWMVQRVIFGPKRRAAEHGMTDLTLREWRTVVPLLAAILLIGVYPQPFLSASRVPAEELIQRVARPRAARPQGAGLQRPPDPDLPGAARAEGER